MDGRNKHYMYDIIEALESGMTPAISNWSHDHCEEMEFLNGDGNDGHDECSCSEFSTFKISNIKVVSHHEINKPLFME